jgi:pyruvate-formate lyase-activating enzyme
MSPGKLYDQTQGQNEKVKDFIERMKDMGKQCSKSHVASAIKRSFRKEIQRMVNMITKTSDLDELEEIAIRVEENTKEERSETQKDSLSYQRPKCFYCKKEGHTSRFCMSKIRGWSQRPKEFPRINTIVSTNHLIWKSLHIGDKQCMVLLDTGSTFNIMSAKMANQLRVLLKECPL